MPLSEILRQSLLVYEFSWSAGLRNYRLQESYLRLLYVSGVKIVKRQ